MTGIKLQFKTLLESVKQVVADLWSMKGKIISCIETALLLFSSNPNIKLVFKKAYSTVSKFSLKGLIVLFIYKTIPFPLLMQKKFEYKA